MHAIDNKGQCYLLLGANVQFAHLFLLCPRRLDFRRHLFVLHIGKANLFSPYLLTSYF